MWILLWIISSFLRNFASAGNSSFILPPKTVELCKEHTCRDGYGYKTFYRVDSEDMKQIKKDFEVAFEMHIGIQAASDGHILLSPVPNPGEMDAVYEIVVGGGNNKFTEIRRNIKKNAKTSIMTPNILSPFEMRGFYVRISDDGFVEFGNEGDVLPLLSFKDIYPLEIKYFSFSAWYGTVAKFLYDCPDTNLTEPTMNSQEVEPPPISPSDQLKRMQLMYRLPWISPKPNMEVTLGIKVTSVKYHASESKLVTAASIVISWTDESMGWYPPKFNGTQSIKFRPGQIWRPKLYVFNSATGVLDSKNSGVIKVLPSGEATFHFQTKITTWCYDAASGYNRWPHDEYMCSIVIQPWESHDKISFKVMDPQDSRMQIYADIDKVIENDWEVETEQVVIKSSVWNEVYMNKDNETHQSDRLIISLVLARRPTTYNIVFYTPLVVLLVFILMSFWTEPLKMERIWFYTGCIIVITMGLCYIDYLMPCYTMPSILVLYITVLAGVAAALLIQALLMMTVTEKLCNVRSVQNIFRSNLFRNICCLPAIKPSSNGGYMIQDDEETEDIVPKGSNVEEMDRENQDTQNSVKDLAEVIDKVLFFVYTITFSVMLADHF